MQISVWDDPEIFQFAKREFEAGTSAKETAKLVNIQFGAQITRNSVLSVANRRGWRSPFSPKNKSPDGSPKRKHKRAPWALPNDPPPPKRQKPKPVKEIDPLELLAIDDAAIPFEQRRSILTIERGECRFVVGDPKTGNYFFCGAPVKPDSSFCPGHHARCYVTAAELRRQAIAERKELATKDSVKRQFRFSGQRD